MRLIKGNKLTPSQRDKVLRSYIYRHLDTTCKTDEAWLKAHAFYITSDGRLSHDPQAL